MIRGILETFEEDSEKIMKGLQSNGYEVQIIKQNQQYPILVMLRSLKRILHLLIKKQFLSGASVAAFLVNLSLSKAVERQHSCMTTGFQQ
jgi:hypothetical protein